LRGVVGEEAHGDTGGEVPVEHHLRRVVVCVTPHTTPAYKVEARKVW
jgi:hypothetical protein